MQGQIRDPDLNRMSITVAEVRMSPDLTIATAFMMPLGGKNYEEAIEALSRNTREITRALAKQVTLKNTPKLRFMIDETFDRMEETRRLLGQESVQRDLGDE